MMNLLRAMAVWLLEQLKLKKQTTAQKWASKWKRDCLNVLKETAKIEKRLKSQEKVMREELEEYEELLDQSTDRLTELRKLVEGYDKAEEALNNELEQLREVQIPYLAQIIEDLRQQLAANTALNVGRQVLFGGGGKKESQE